MFPRTYFLSTFVKGAPVLKVYRVLYLSGGIQIKDNEQHLQSTHFGWKAGQDQQLTDEH